MSKTRLSKPGFSAKSVLTIMLIAASSGSYAAESIDQLATRIGMEHFREAIKRVIAAPSKRCRQKAIKTDLLGCSSKLTPTLTPNTALLIAIRTPLLSRRKNTKHSLVAAYL